jgi:hypothetical protein
LKIRAGFDIAFNCAKDVPMLLMLTVHPSRRSDLLSSDKIEFSPKSTGPRLPRQSTYGLTIAKAFGLVFTLPDDLKDVYLNVFKNDLAKRNGDPSWQAADAGTLRDRP